MSGECVTVCVSMCDGVCVCANFAKVSAMCTWWIYITLKYVYVTLYMVNILPTLHTKSKQIGLQMGILKEIKNFIICS